VRPTAKTVTGSQPESDLKSVGTVGFRFWNSGGEKKQWRGPPSSLVQFRMPFGPAMLVTHDPSRKSCIQFAVMRSCRIYAATTARTSSQAIRWATAAVSGRRRHYRLDGCAQDREADPRWLRLARTHRRCLGARQAGKSCGDDPNVLTLRNDADDPKPNRTIKG
jgi:hypothetical protein